MVIEYARNMTSLSGAHTTEIDKKTKFPVIDIMEHQKKLMAEENYGGSMRLGAYPCLLKKGTHAHAAYARAKWGDEKKTGLTVSERHRHRYEVNNEYLKELESSGLVFSGTSPDGTLMEIAELKEKDHPFFVGTQFHPEFLARPLNPHPLFTSFIKAASKL